MTNLKIGQELKIIGHSVKQKGYGRQALYVDVMFDNGVALKKMENIYVKDVFPNVIEQYQDQFYIKEFGAYDEETGLWTRESGNGEYTDEQMFDSIDNMLNHVLSGHEIDIQDEEE